MNADSVLLFVEPARNPRVYHETISSLRSWVRDPRDDASLDDAVRGRRALAVIPAGLSGAAAKRFAADGVTVRVLPRDHWHNALPMPFRIMLLAIAITGAIAFVRSEAFFVWASPAMVMLLLVAAWQRLRVPLIRFPLTTPALPASARATLSRSLAALRAGRARTLLLDLARVAEHTYSGLPALFREHDLGRSIVDLVTEAGPLAQEADRLSAIADGVGENATPSAGDAAQLRAAAEQRIALLQQTLQLLGRIARDGAASDRSVAAEVGLLLGRVRQEHGYRTAAEEVVEETLR